MDHDDEGFWPGYVAALAGLMQGLLLLTGVVCVAIFAVSREVVRASRADASAAAQAEIAASAAASERAFQLASARPTPALVRRLTQIRTPEQAATAAAVPTTSAPETMRPDDGGLIELHFAPGAWQLSEADQRSLAEDVRGVAKPGQRWRMWTRTDTAAPESRRAAFVRLMTVRNALVHAGLPSDSIEVRLLSGESDPDGTQRVRIAPIEAPLEDVAPTLGTSQTSPATTPAGQTRGPE